MSPKTIAHLLLMAVAFIYGANYVWAKEVMPNPISPNAFILMRAGGATLLFWTFLRKYWIFPEKMDTKIMKIEPTIPYSEAFVTSVFLMKYRSRR
jgi:drug/metabolite transporter (DMT)-like permease